jgi:hypothetical protein
MGRSATQLAEHIRELANRSEPSRTVAGSRCLPVMRDTERRKKQIKKNFPIARAKSRRSNRATLRASLREEDGGGVQFSQNLALVCESPCDCCGWAERGAIPLQDSFS